jgi:hypothetical protein
VISEYQIRSKFVDANTLFSDRHGENEYFSVYDKDLLKIIILRYLEVKVVYTEQGNQEYVVGNFQYYKSKCWSSCL